MFEVKNKNSKIIDDARELLGNNSITLDNLIIYYGKLTTWLYEEHNCTIKVSEKYLRDCALDLVKYGEALSLYNNHSDVDDEEAIWILNPGDFKEDYA